MRFVLTGASGFIGFAVAKQLLENKHAVCALIRPDSDQEMLRSLNGLEFLDYVSLTDLNLANRLKSWLPEVFIHLAWKGVGAGDRDLSYQFSENIPFSLQAIHLAAAAGCNNWVGIGSQAEYGIPNSKINEDAMCMPVTAYGKAKLAAGIAAMGLCETLNIRGAWCRVFSIYGPGDHIQTFIPYVISSFVRKQSPLLTRCEQQWDYLYITDAAEAIIRIAECKCSGVYNIGSGETVSLKNVVELIKKETRFTSDVHYGLKDYSSRQIMHLEADVTKVKAHTNWQPKTGLEAGIASTVNTFKLKFNNESI